MNTTPRVRNMCSPRTGSPVANQFIIEDGNREVFQSYDTVIAVRESGGDTTLDIHALDYSKTTSEYLYEFLRADRATVMRLIADGTYPLAHLNR